MKLAFAVLLLLLPLLGLTQEGGEMQTADVHQDDEKALEELEATRDQRQKTFESLQKVGDVSKAPGPTLNPEDQLKKLGYSGPTDPAAYLSPKALTELEKLVKEAKMWEIPEEDLRQQVLSSFEGSAFGGFVKSSPKLQGFIVGFMRDKKAMLNAISILKDHDRLKTYLYIWIGIMFATYYLRQLFISKYWKKPTRIFAGLMFSLTIMTINLSVFCIIFSDEMKPIIALVKKHF